MHPEEVAHILRYFGSLKEPIKWIERLIQTLHANTATTDRHAYVISKEVYDCKLASDAILQFSRETLRERDSSGYTRDYAWAILGEYGDSSDLDAIEADYSKETSDLAKATILCSIRRMVKDRRNSIYSRAKGDSALTDLAIEWARTKHG